MICLDIVYCIILNCVITGMLVWIDNTVKIKFYVLNALRYSLFHMFLNHSIIYQCSIRFEHDVLLLFLGEIFYEVQWSTCSIDVFLHRYKCSWGKLLMKYSEVRAYWCFLAPVRTFLQIHILVICDITKYDISMFNQIWTWCSVTVPGGNC